MEILQLVSAIILTCMISCLLYCLFRVLKTLFVLCIQKNKLTLEHSKIIYFLCSTPMLFTIFSISFTLSFYFYTPIYEYNIMSILFDIIVIIFLCIFLRLNYNFIKISYKRNMAKKWIILLLSCLPGLSMFLFLLPGELAVLGITFLIIAPLCNAYIISENKKHKKTGKAKTHNDTWGEVPKNL